ncbi:hypothetical protein BCR33DRAFT_718121 [Rhizoclosmatium globosum]|uniref:Uncharacterized protein n=1 Tax=Rhizoclosmatium globosum TaxID=329046 RepID=A0A1Y2C757_9FUNG|nr:hypothetical protein BCR33DRAFT_718077 [Rhizoclosmatium globosum]ORY42863.1 hypothetical protein BCR33DRAFT_718078 [Rhizoclosmatium globosum]ORY42864.1 hypothetical protein BCR33DRAFT_718079 [Rhizoclosmatium globosum]ORY42865.1 hypothetical protein BCR33DRAFT_718080 [Rhizoclosmatium globosum]ORY42866.1 hypothetical protein BCR33DRAFT_718081 [Rhizoclosmatium globosum]|eukprot:ORY42862.1 hypothetical protein BCR33DRAFT_718077 [Rhizoclosmatium globosum]
MRPAPHKLQQAHRRNVIYGSIRHVYLHHHTMNKSRQHNRESAAFLESCPPSGRR